MTAARLAIILAFALVIGAPFFVRHTVEGRRTQPVDPDAPKLIVITPHVEQIRIEFERAFAHWHQRSYGTQARIDWRNPGGTTEIRKQLEAQVRAAIERPGARTFKIIPARTLELPDREGRDLPEVVFEPGAIDVDAFMGGGPFEHAQIKSGIVLETAIGGRVQKVRIRISSPPLPEPFPQAALDEIYGQNAVGAEKLYDPDQFWFGTALSGFGIVYNRDELKALGLPEPQAFADLGDPRYTGLLAMSDPRQSGSVATAYDSILNTHGWDAGWRLLREMCANARYFSAYATQPPTDVAQGEAAAGVAIDFYGRGQAQALLSPGQSPDQSRLGYIDPPGGVYIDADPISLINGAGHPELAKHFVEFCLSDEGQALWQFPPRTDPISAHNPPIPSEPLKLSASKATAAAPASERMGPEQYRLRRMPVRRSMYANYLPFFTDKTDPFTAASQTEPRGWRDGMTIMMGCFGIDTSVECRAAWRALNLARGNTIFPQDRLEEMERLFYAFPICTITGKDGATQQLPFSEVNYQAISADTNRWRDPLKSAHAKVAYTEFFSNNYRRVIELAKWKPEVN